jgi:hypothetical protein
MIHSYEQLQSGHFSASDETHLVLFGNHFSAIEWQMLHEVYLKQLVNIKHLDLGGLVVSSNILKKLALD